jgi:methylase of polypeptide subunit release factors
MKDNFSTNSDSYLQYRPDYPEDFFAYLKALQSDSENVWDCGTGTGQVAQKLAGRYKNVFASDS